MKSKILLTALSGLLFTPVSSFADCAGQLESWIEKDFEASVFVSCATSAALVVGACEVSTLALGTPGCLLAGIGVEAVCTLLGNKALLNKAHAVAGDVCDYAGAISTAPFVVVQNLLTDHQIDFSVDIPHGDDVHQRGTNWLDPTKTNILSSNKMQAGHTYTVKARVKIAGKSDVHLQVDGVKPSEYVISVNYDGGYHINKQARDFNKK